ncbi:MAG: restriction endonuclease subunit S [Gammaproteobacteria bacterium]|nr:restriction endonuclease subunit S [Gammaproteobacteria bacterium]
MNKTEKIPVGWLSKRLSHLIKKLDAGVSVNSENRSIQIGEYGILKTSAVTNGVFNANENKVIISTELKRARISPTRDRIIMSRMNTPTLVGANAYVPETREDLFLPDRLWQLVPKANSVNMKWLSLVLCSPKYRAKLSSFATGTSNSMKNITKEDVNTLPILLPPIPEQKAIADLLSTWNKAIEKTERLIEVKEKQFKWLISTLSQGKNKWDKVKLGEICKVKKGKQLNVAHMKESGIYYALNGGIQPSGRTDDWNAEADTITISEGGNSCGYVNFNTEKFWSGGHCYSLFNLQKSVDNQYLFFYLKMNEQKLMNLRVGSGLPNIQKKDLDSFPVLLPILLKQKQIAEILSTVKQESNVLKQLAEKYKTQKRGLMQKLLTGEWRAKPEIVNQDMEL